MIYFRSKRQAKGIWRIHLYDRTIKVENGLAVFENEPPASVMTAMRLRGFEQVEAPDEKPKPAPKAELEKEAPKPKKQKSKGK